MSRPIHPSGISTPSWRTSPPAAGSPILPPGPSAVMSWGTVMGAPESSSAPAGVDLVGLEQAGADVVALGGQEGEAHAAADDEAVGHARAARSITPSLSLTFDPPEHDHEGPTRVVAQRQQHLDLAGQQPPGRAGQEPRRADDRGVGPVRGAEGVVDVGVLTLDQPLHEGRIVGRLTRVEAQVLEQLDARRQLGQALARPARPSTGDRARPSGRPRWVQAVTVAPRRLQPLDGGQGGPDAQVVGDVGRPRWGR